MARWKARVVFLLSVIELLFLSLTVEALQGKRCQDSLLPTAIPSVCPSVCHTPVLCQEGECQFEPRFQGGRGRPCRIFLVSTKLGTFCYPTVQTAPFYVPSFWHNTGVWRTERQTDGIAVASTALAMRALRRAVKMTEIGCKQAINVRLLLFLIYHWYI